MILLCVSGGKFTLVTIEKHVDAEEHFESGGREQLAGSDTRAHNSPTAVRTQTVGNTAAMCKCEYLAVKKAILC